MQIVKKGDVELITFDNLTQTGMVKHGFTTRHGGVSTGYYGTMNMGFSRGEDRAPVAENYRILARALELDENAYVATQQTHTTNVLKVTAKDKGCGVTKDRTYHDIDGLMTNEKGINLVIFGADCVPVFLLDTKNNIETFLTIPLVSKCGLSFPSIIVPIVAGVTTFLQSKVMTSLMNTTASAENDQAAAMTQSMNKMMLYFMPIMMAFFCLQVPAGLGVYWTISNIFGILQQIFLQKFYKKKMAEGAL